MFSVTPQARLSQNKAEKLPKTFQHDHGLQKNLTFPTFILAAGLARGLPSKNQTNVRLEREKSLLVSNSAHSETQTFRTRIRKTRGGFKDE